MPRLARPRTGVLDDLADQLRFTPRSALLHQIKRAEVLAGEIEPRANYPEDWLIRRITGYRPEIDEPALLVGSAILSDLSAFVELLCDRAKLTREDVDAGALTLDELCARWGVERRSIERYRRRGLVARRVRGRPGGAALMFTPSAINAFEKRRDGSGSGDPGGHPAPSARRRRSFDEAEEAWRAWRDGASVGEIAARVGRTRSAVHHAIAVRRAAHLRGLDLPSPGDALSAVDAERVLSSSRAHTGLSIEAWGDGREFVESASAGAKGISPATAREVERTRGLALAALRARAAFMIATLPGKSRGDGVAAKPAAATLDRIETDLRWATRLVCALVHGEAPLILRTIEERAGIAFLDLAPAHAVGWFESAMSAACGAALRFDPLRGGRLAAPISIALSHALAGMAVVSIGASRARGLVRLPDWTLGATPWQSMLEPGERARRVMRLDNADARVLRARYGIGGNAPKTMAEIEQAFGVSVSRLAKLERGRSDASA